MRGTALMALACLLGVAAGQDFDWLSFTRQMIGVVSNLAGSSNASASEGLQLFCDDAASAPEGREDGFGDILDSCRRRRMNLVLLVDSSRSTADDAEFRKVKDMLKSLVRNFEIGLERSRVAVVQYTAGASTAFDFAEHSSVAAVSGAIDRLRQTPVGFPNPAAGLAKVRADLLNRRTSGWQAGLPTVLVTVTTRSSAGAAARAQMAQLLRTPNRGGIFPIVLAVQPDDVKAANGRNLPRVSGFLQQQATLRREQLVELANGLESNVLVACGFDRVDETLAIAAAQQICSLVDQTCRKAAADVVFLVEDAGDDNSANRRHLKGFLQRMTENVDLSDQATRVAVYQYSEGNTVDKQLAISGSRGQIEGSIARMRALPTADSRRGPQKSALYHAVLKAWQDYNAPRQEFGSREGADTVVIVIARSSSQISPLGLTNAFRSRGVPVIAVGVGTEIDQKDLEAIHGNGETGRRMRVRNYAGLSRQRRNHLASIVCASKSAIRLTGGVLSEVGCIHGDPRKFSGVSLGTKRRLSWQTATPKVCLDACPADTRVVAIKNRLECYCGSRAWSRAEVAGNAAQGGDRWCSTACLLPNQNPQKIKCGSGLAMSLYEVTGAEGGVSLDG